MYTMGNILNKTFSFFRITTKQSCKVLGVSPKEWAINMLNEDTFFGHTGTCCNQKYA